MASYTFIIGGLMVLVFSYMIWWHQLGKLEISTSDTVLWFAVANFLYYGLVVPVAAANNWLVLNSPNQAFTVHVINLIMYGVWAIIIGIGFIYKCRVWIS